MQFFTVLGVFIGIPALLSMSALLNGWVLSYLWLWFIVPLGVPALQLGHAIGVSCLISFATYQELEGCAKEKTEYAERVGEILGTFVVRPLSVFAFGWVLQNFFM